MTYLIGQLAGWLLLTAAFAALAGWAYAAQRTRPGYAAHRRHRDALVRDLVSLANGENGAANDGTELDVARRLGELNAGRVLELEQLLEAARGRADEGAARMAEMQRALDAREAQPHDAIDVDAQAAEDEADAALQHWRLRYFEQRVRYLEGRTKDSDAVALAAPAPPPAPVEEWRARTAEARAAHLEDEVRTLRAQEAAAQDSPFAANADIDALLRWRMLYLERRVVHLQEAAAQVSAAPVSTSVAATVAAPLAAPVSGLDGPDPDRWKWRARYLEARTRHLEQRLAETPAARMVAAPDLEMLAPPPPANVAREKPAILSAARNGAPDDLTLIDGVSLLQQTTLYALGVFHFDQIAAWTQPNVAWVDQYLRLRGRIGEEEWVDQAEELAREGPVAVRRAMQEEEA